MLRKVVISVAIVVVLLVVLYSVMVTFVARSYLIPSEGMAPTLNVGDHLIVNKLTYRFSSPQPGDVIVFTAPPAWSVGYQSIRSNNTVLRWLQNALSVVGLVPLMRTTWSSGSSRWAGRQSSAGPASDSRWTANRSPSRTWTRTR